MAKKKKAATPTGLTYGNDTISFEERNGILYRDGISLGPAAEAWARLNLQAGTPAQVSAAAPLTAQKGAPQQAQLPISMATPPTSAVTPYAPVKRGPSLSGPLTSGWTSSSLVPKTTTAVTASPLPTTPADALRALVRGPAGGAVSAGGTGAGTGGSDLSQYRLSEEELGTPPDLRRVAPNTTPLEQLLASIFPDAAANYDPTAVDPMADPRNPGQAQSLFNTILGNLGTQPVAPMTFAQPTFGAPAPMMSGQGNQIASTIPGAPSFLGGAIDRVNTAGPYMQPMGGATGGAAALNAAGIAALAAEQRAQANQMAQEQAAADAAFFQQQQARQKAQRMTAQRQRQRFGGVNALTSGWSSNPILF